MTEQVDDVFPIKIDINPKWSKWKIYEPDKIVGSFFIIKLENPCCDCDDLEKIGLIISYETIAGNRNKCINDYNEFCAIMSNGSFRYIDDVNLVYCTEKLEI